MFAVYCDQECGMHTIFLTLVRKCYRELSLNKHNHYVPGDQMLCTLRCYDQYN